MHVFDELRKSDYWIGSEIRVSGSRNMISIRGSKEIRLQPRLISVLTVLASRSPEVVAREEVIQIVWKDFYTGDLALNQCISKLRKVFEDSSLAPKVIETVIKSGYRLVPPIYTKRPVGSLGFAPNRVRNLRRMGALALVVVGFIYLGILNNPKPEPVLLMQDPDNLMTEELYAKIQRLAENPESYDEIVKELKLAFPDSTFEISTSGSQSLLIYNK